MSAHKRKYRIRDGLPRCIACDADGFERLKTTLRLNRHFCRKLLDSPHAKKQINTYRKELLRKRMPSGERDRLLLFKLYGDPDFRRRLWTGVYDRILSGDEKELTGMFPSLEHRILTNYIHDYRLSGADSTRSDESFGEWPDLVQHLKEGVQGAGFAAHAWVGIRSRLNSWDSLDDEQRTDITLAAFAVATIVDDERILRAVIKEVSELEAEFGDVLDATGGSDTASDEDILLRWAKLCESLRMLSEKAAGPPPVVDVLVEIQRVVNEFSEIEQPVREHSARIPFDRLMSRVNGLFKLLNEEHVFSWLGETERARLRAKWERARPSLSLDKICEERDRLDEMAVAKAEDLRKIRAKLSDDESRRRLLRTENPADLAARHSLEERLDGLDESILKLRREQRQARIDLLSQLSPFGETFEMDRDYSDSLPSQAHHRDTGESVRTRSVIEPERPAATRTTGPAEAPPASPASDTEVEQQEVEEIEKDDILHDLVTSTAHEGTITHEPVPQGKRAELSDEIEFKPMEPIAPSPVPEAKELEPEGGRKADPLSDPLAARAVERMTEALNEPSPRISYAVHVIRLITRLGVAADHPPVVLLEAALLSDRMSLPDGAVASELAKVLDRFPSADSFADADDSTRDRYMMLALAGTLRPALLSPQSGAWGLLSALKPSERLGSVYRFVNQIAEKSQRLQGVRIDSLVLKAASSEADWKAECEQLRLDAALWQRQAQHMTIVYAPATSVWQKWLSPNGLIGNLMYLIAADGENDARIEGEIDRLQTKKKFNEAVRKTDRKEVGRQSGPDIQARALTQLYEHAQHAVGLAFRHLSLRRSQPSQSNFLTQELARLQDGIRRFGPPALEELRELAGREKSLFTGAANTAAYAIEQFSNFLDNRLDQEPDPKELVASELLCFPTIPIGHDGSVAGDPQQALDTLLSTEPRTLKSSLDLRLKTGDFGTARRIISWMETNDLDNTEDIRSRFDEALNSEKRTLRNEMDDAGEEVEEALARGHLSDTERDTYAAALVEMEQRAADPQMVEFDQERAELCKIRKEIESALDVQRSRDGSTAREPDDQLRERRVQKYIRLY